MPGSLPDMDYLAHLGTAMAAVRAAVLSGDLDEPVPTTPGWTRRDLVHHLAGAHRWAQGAILQGHPNTPEPDPPADPSPAAWAHWYQGHADDLLATLAATDPQAPCWAFGPRPRVAGFWRRRQTHECVVHLADLEPGTPVDAGLALDGIDEIVSMFFPRQVRLERIPPLTHSLAVEAVDAPDGTGRWVIAAAGEPAGQQGPADADERVAEATVRGPAAALYLLLWRRLALTDPRIALVGDRQAALAVLDAGIVP